MQGTTVEECSDVHLVSVEEYVPFNYTWVSFHPFTLINLSFLQSKI
jgi:hypothetical protein